MASVYRQDTGEFLGYLMELHGPKLHGTTHWPFKAWRHSNGALRDVPEGPVARGGRLTAPPFQTIHIPVANVHEADMHLIVPPELVEFITNHSAFRALAKPTH